MINALVGVESTLNKMLEIKFRKNYPKLWNQTSAILIDINFRNRKFLHKDFIEYDTKSDDGTYYNLSSGMLIQLVFIGNKGIPFCTIRRWTPGKANYYAEQLGKDFEIKYI